MEFSDVIQRRRSVNFFDPKRPVEEDLLKKLVETAALAPSGFNLQPWNLLVLTKSKDKEKLRKFAWDQAKITEAPVVLVVLADLNGWEKGHPIMEKNFTEMMAVGTPEEKYEWYENTLFKLYGQDEQLRQAFACKNAAFFAMSLMLAAKDLGLDTHPMDGIDHDEVRKAFKIPENFLVPYLIAVGYFDYKQNLAAPKWRKSYDDIVVTFK